MSLPLSILVTAGPTREPLDAVRYLSNHSSGQMGMAIAAAGARAGHAVRLLLGPGPRVTDEPGLSACTVERFGSTADLERLLARHWGQATLLIMAAAVADYRPATIASGKLPRQKDQPLTLTLEPTPDLVAQCARVKKPGQCIIAFALEEPAHLEARATEKLARKGVDAIIANPLQTMNAPDVAALWLTADGERVSLPMMSKPDFAAWVIARAEAWTQA